MQTMVEKLAKTLGDTINGYVDPIDTPNTWAQSVFLARVALTALRDPTEGMQNAGSSDAVQIDYCAGVHGVTLGYESTRTVWQAMIDQALTEGE